MKKKITEVKDYSISAQTHVKNLPSDMGRKVLVINSDYLNHLPARINMGREVLVIDPRYLNHLPSCINMGRQLNLMVVVKD